jgi:acetate kinase
MTMLTVNSGSSSIRLDTFRASHGGVVRVASRHVEGSNSGEALVSFLAEAGPIDAVAHRVVHGGARLSSTVAIDSRLEAQIASLVPLAPLHNAPALEAIRAARQATGPAIPHFAVFDTAFFAGLPEASRTYALPAPWRERFGLRRFGFHGLAHAWMWRRWAARNPAKAQRGRAITFQLGSGCSAAAIRAGGPIEASMGFTPLEGLVMATRAGSFDPGIVAFLHREGVPAHEIDAMLARDSGLRGLAGEADLRRIMARDDAAARLAVDVYVRSAKHHLGAYAAALGGVDAVVFGGGVGENQPAIRSRILEGLAWAGLRVDPAANEGPGTERSIAASNSSIDAWVVPVDEGVILAEEAFTALAAMRAS